MNTNNNSSWIAILIMLIPLIYVGFIYNSLPASVPMHFSTDGTIDRYGSKTEFAITIFAMELIAAGVYFLIKNIYKIDPKKTAKYSSAILNKIGLAIVVFVSALSLLITYAVSNKAFKTGDLVMPALGLFLAYIGNLMYSIKQNYFFGVRTPWALENEENWRKTHQFGSKFFFAGGLLITILSLVLKEKAAFISYMIIIALIVFIPVIYSYLIFKKENKVNA